MKLASLKSGRDGQLVVVSRDLSRYAVANDIAATLQHALDAWSEVSGKLADLSDKLNSDPSSGDRLDTARCHSPLPRAFQWADGSAYVNHVELVRKARNAKMPDSFWTDPLMYQGGSDTFLAPCDPIPVESETWGIDFEGEIAVITGDVPMGATADSSADHIRLFMLVNDVSLRGLIPAELSKGFGFFHSKPSSAFSPVAITPDELGSAWDGQRVSLPLVVRYNNELFGQANAGQDMTFDFPTLVAHAAKTRPLQAGTIIGSGTISNKDEDGSPGRPISEGGVGYSCIAELRMIETIRDGKPTTPFMKFGDKVSMEMLDQNGETLFGTIDQEVVRYELSTQP